MSDELLSRLQRLTIDEPGAAMSFHRRLAHENGWSDAFASRVIDEYRRFVWLAVRAGHAVTPSPAVDEAWHLHLCYTRSYWTELCAGILGRPLHHGPTHGGADEAAKYDAWYRRTLASYRAHFGEPPADIWPAAAERARAAIPRKVDPREHWIVSKRVVRRAAVAAVAGVALAALAGCTTWLGLDSTDSTVLIALAGVAGVGLIAVVAHAIRHGRGSRGGNGGSHGGGSSCGGGGCATHPGSGCGSDGGSGCGGGGGD